MTAPRAAGGAAARAPSPAGVRDAAHSPAVAARSPSPMRTPAAPAAAPAAAPVPIAAPDLSSYRPAVGGARSAAPPARQPGTADAARSRLAQFTTNPALRREGSDTLRDAPVDARAAGADVFTSATKLGVYGRDGAAAAVAPYMRPDTYAPTPLPPSAVGAAAAAAEERRRADVALQQLQRDQEVRKQAREDASAVIKAAEARVAPERLADGDQRADTEKQLRLQHQAQMDELRSRQKVALQKQQDRIAELDGQLQVLRSQQQRSAEELQPQLERARQELAASQQEQRTLADQVKKVSVR